MRNISLYHTHVSENSKRYVSEVLDSGWLNEGKYVKAFENRLSEFIGSKDTIATSSCTSALHLALLACGARPGRNVVLPSQTFAATGLAVMYTGATPIFSDTDFKSGTINPYSVEYLVNENTVAIIVVDWGGNTCDIDLIRRLCPGIPIIEDAAHSLGAIFPDGSRVGQKADFTCFSFQAVKSVTCGDGGAVASTTLKEKIRNIRWFGISKESKVGFFGDRIWNIQDIGYKYNMNDVSASIGLGNLEEFPARLSRRRVIADIYREELGNIVLHTKKSGQGAYWFYTIMHEQRNRIVDTLRKNGVQASVVHFGIDRHDVFGGQRAKLPGQRVFENMQLAIPCHEALTDDDVGYIIDVIKGELVGE